MNTNDLPRSPLVAAVRATLLAGAALFAAPGHAGIFCVSTSATLQSAIASANSDPEGTVEDIRVRPGSYSLPAGITFNPAGDKDSKDFSITGGWNADCTARTINPATTVISAQNGASRGSFRFLGDHQRIVVESLALRNFEEFEIDDPACGFAQICSGTDAIRVRYNDLRNGGTVAISLRDAAQLSVTGNLFANLSGDSESHTVSIYYLSGGAAGSIGFNTFAGLQCVGNLQPIFVSSSSPGTLIHHNVIQTACSNSLYISDAGGSNFSLRNNLYASRDGGAPAVVTGNVVTTDPRFVNAAGGDFHLRETAPVSGAINTGLTSALAAAAGISAPSQDLDGPAGARLIGNHYDIGAYESAINDSSVITVTNTSDSGAGSLRQALISANAASGLQTVRFDLGTCPKVILLQSELPDVVDDLVIDGYSQTGSSPNGAETGNDSTLCVLLAPSSNTLDQALQVPQAAPASTSLTVKGIAFAGTTGFNGNFTVALRLRGGSDHVIQGNAFSGTGPGSIGSLGQLNFGLQIRGTAQNALVGGPEPEHRNTFGSMQSSAIVLNDSTSGGHTIQNNYIGLTPSGLVASPIALNGIFASGVSNVHLLDNVIAASASGAVVLTLNASGFDIQRNRLGVNAINIPNQALRNDQGIRISNGAFGNAIGHPTSGLQSNVISNSDGPGVWITTDAGNGNLVRPNKIFGNGVSGSGLGIDIGELGALPNDAGDGDGGANRGQNFPVINDSVHNADGTRQLALSLNSTPSSGFRIDVYRSVDCPGGNRGGQLANRVGTFTLNTSAGGNATLNAALSGTGAPGYLTATATSLTTQDTSEISACLRESDGVFGNGFE